MRKIYSYLLIMLLSALSFTAKAATATVYIDKPDAVMFYVYYGGGDWNQTELPNSGDTPNIIEFDETRLQLFEFDPYNLNTGIYKITKNNEEIDLAVAFNDEGFEIYGVKDGDVIRVQVARPDNVLSTFTFEKGAEAIASVENADTGDFYTVENNVFKAKTGDRVVLRPKNNYDIKSALLNGEEMQYIMVSGCYFFVVESDNNVISIDATEKTQTVEMVDEIPGTTLTLTSKYTQQILECESGSAWILTLKNEGDGPQMKPENGGIVTKTSIGKIKKVEVNWGTKSNEDIVVYGSHEPITDPLNITGEQLGTINFVAESTTSLEIAGDWEYIGMTATANKGKACQFNTMAVTWEVEVVEEEPDPQEGIVLNEICGNDGTADDGSEDWIELANPTNTTISLAGAKLQIISSEGEETDLCILGTDAIVAPGEYLLFKRTVHFTAGIPHSKNIIVKLISAAGKTLSKFDKRATLTDNGHHNKGGSYSRIPDMTGDWAAVQNCTSGAENDGTPIQPDYKQFWLVSSEEELKDGMNIVLTSVNWDLIDESYDLNNEPYPSFTMSSSWSTTKDGAVYLFAEPSLTTRRDPVFPHIYEHVEFDANRVAVLTLEAAGDGKWALRFGETNNYKNEDSYLACEEFKSLKFKSSIDKNGVACTITFNNEDAEISYGEMAGSLKFNYKGDGTDRFLNYDPLNKPEEHLAIRIYQELDELPVGITEVQGSSSNVQNSTYNLAGQKVTSDYKGIVIKNGKKFLKNL